MKIGYIGNEKEMPEPKKVTLDYIELSREDRTASGKKVKDIIGVKKIFIILYDGLTTTNINMLINLYEAGKPVNYIYYDAGKVKSAEVYLTSIPRDLYIPKPQYSKNITITLEEV